MLGMVELPYLHIEIIGARRRGRTCSQLQQQSDHVIARMPYMLSIMRGYGTYSSLSMQGNANAG